ncbi:MAG: tetratricopeptide repeat protein [Isosphaeraceae bacterium]
MAGIRCLTGLIGITVVCSVPPAGAARQDGADASLKPGSQVLPRGPGLVLRDGDRSSTAPPYPRVFVVEAVEGDHVRLFHWAQKGTAPVDRVIAIEQAQAVPYFEGRIKQHPKDPYAWLARAVARQAQKDLVGAVADCDEAIRLDPGMAHAYSCRAAARPPEDSAQSLADLEQALRIKANDAILLADRAGLHAERGELDQSERYAEESIRADPNCPRGYLARAYLRVSRQEFGLAIEDLDRALRLDPTDSYAYMLRGGCLFETKDLARALADFDEAIRRDPKNADAYFGRASYYNQAGDLAKAARDCDEAIRLDPRHAQAFGLRGSIRFRQGNRAQALADSSRALELDPTDRASRKMRAAILFRDGRFKEAIAEYDALLQAERRDTEALHGRAVCHQRLGNLREAMVDLDEAIRIDPRCVGALSMRLALYLQQGDYDQALADADRAVEIAPRDGIMFLNRAQVHCQRNEPEKKRADFQSAARLGIKDPQLYLPHARFLLKNGKPDAALAEANDVVAALPEQALSYAFRGFVYQQLGQYPNAQADFDAAIARGGQLPGPRLAFTYAWRGIIRMRQKDLDGALEDLKASLARDPRCWDAIQGRGEWHEMKQEFREALADYDEVVRQGAPEPGYSNACIRRAWIRATCPDDSVRDGKLAVESATEAVRRTKSERPDYLLTLAAAQAEAGDFDAANRTAQKARSRIQPGDRSEAFLETVSRQIQQHEPLRSGRPVDR